VNVLGELKQRKVLKTAALYFAVAWGGTEILTFLIDRIPVFPAWAETVIAILFVLGFPVTVFLSWIFDAGPEGVRHADPASGLGKGVIVISLAGLLVATGALSYLIWPRIQAEQGIVSEGDLGTVAVLPLKNLTGDPSLGYLGVGLAEDIRQRLLAQTDLKVTGRVSLAGFGGTGTDLAAVRNLLGAGLVLEGNMQSIAGRLQVGISLMDTATGQQVWGNIFSAGETGWGPLRQRIVTSLAEQLALTVRIREAEAPIPDEALMAYMHALSELAQPEVADSWFDQANRLAPEFADAWARKSLLRVDMIWRGMPPQQAWEEAEHMFTRAREIEPGNLLADIAEAHLQWLAKVDAIASFDVLQRTEARAPNHPLVLGGLSSTLSFIPGRAQDAEDYGRRYLAQDPLNPDAHTSLGLALQFNGKLDQAQRELDRALELDPHYMRAWDYKANWEFFLSSPADALVTYTRRGQVEAPPSDETVRCKLYMAGALLPIEQAEPLLRNAIQRGLGMTVSHWWCENTLETLQGELAKSGRTEEAEAIKKQLLQWREVVGSTRTASENFDFDEDVVGHCQTDLCRIREALGDEAMAVWLGPDPPLHYFNFGQAVDISHALIEAGRFEEGRRLATLAAPKVKDHAGPQGHPSVTGNAVMLLALSGDIEGALEYAEQVGPEGFFVFGRNLDPRARDLKLSELTAGPRWAVLMERCKARWLEEVEKFDRLVASGDIIMP
jgi:TolB-like protein/Flp pilus assembly protein TadD